MFFEVLPSKSGIITDDFVGFGDPKTRNPKAV